MLILVPTAGEARFLFGGTVPPAGVPGPVTLEGAPVEAALCGFGPAAAGVLSTQALLASEARGCLLVGMAGSYRPEVLPVGGVLEVAEVRTADIGRGRGPAFVGPLAMGTPQAPSAGEHAAVLDRISLGPPEPSSGDGTLRGVLLTVASSAASAEEAAERLAAHPDALAEDMETFSVALACERLGVRLTVLRGISNVVGEPDPRRWEREPALRAAGRAAARCLGARN